MQSKKNADSGFWNYADSFTYTAAGAVSSMQLGNGKWESTQFNSRLQPTQFALGTVQGGADKLNLAYEYGTWENGVLNAQMNNGNVAKQTINVLTQGTANGFTAVQKYEYDPLNRLKSAVENIDGNQTPSWKQTFTFDRYGNRRFDEANTNTLDSNCPTAVCNPQVDPATNKLIGYQFDNSGNTKVDATNRQFIYDGEDKQVEVRDAAGNPIGKYLFDGDGKRVKKISATEFTVFVYNASGQLVAEYSTQTTQTPQVSYLTADHLGSPRINTDHNGNTTARHDFQPFGEEIFSSQRTTGLGYTADTVRQKFTTYERDSETNFDYAKARMFVSNFGRFTSPDPYNIVLEYKAEKDQEKARLILIKYLNKAQQWNRYVYVTNNPLVYVDPLGESLELTGTQKEKDKSFDRILELCGEKCRGRLYIEIIDGRTYVKYDDNKGGLSGNAGNIGTVLEHIIDSTINVELQVTSKENVTWSDGKTENLKSRSALTRHLSSTSTQIFISDSVPMSVVADTAGFVGVKTADGSKYTTTESIQLAHELGHAWGAVIDNFAEKYSKLAFYQSGSSLINQNNDRSVQVENWQRDRLGLPHRSNH